MASWLIKYRGRSERKVVEADEVVNAGDWQDFNNVTKTGDQTTKTELVFRVRSDEVTSIERRDDAEVKAAAA